MLSKVLLVIAYFGISCSAMQNELMVFLEYFDNTAGGGRLYFNKKCDPFWFTGMDLCDMAIQVCIEPITTNPTLTTCSSGWIDLGQVTLNNNKAVFAAGTTYGGWKNPMIFNADKFFSGNVQGFTFKYIVMDVDSGNRQLIDQNICTLRVPPGTPRGTISCVDDRPSGFPASFRLAATVTNVPTPNPPFTWPTTPSAGSTPGGNYPPGWYGAADMLLKAVDTSVNPCNDFFSYSCGIWHQTHENYTSVFEQLQDVISDNLTQIFTQGYIPANSSAMKKISQIYQICLNDANNYHGAQLLKIMNQYGGWPMTSNAPWNGTKNFHLENLMSNWFVQFGMPTFLSPMVDTNWKDNTGNFILHIDQAQLTLPNVYYNTPQIWKSLRQGYIQYIVQVAATVNSDQNNTANFNYTQALIDADAMVTLEEKLANVNVSVPNAQLRNFTQQYNMFTVETLMKRWPLFNWKTYFANFPMYGPIPRNYFVTANISITEPSFVTQALPIIKTTPNRVLQNYMMWRFAYSKFQYLTQFKKIDFEFKRKLDPTRYPREFPPLEEDCAGTATNIMSYAGGALYVEQIWGPSVGNDNYKNISRMIDDIIQGFKKELIGLSWMDGQTKQNAITKAYGIIKNIAAPEWIFNTQKLDTYYNGFTFSANNTDMMGISDATTKFMISQMLAKLTQSGNRILPSTDTFNGAPQTVNAWYQPQFNSITFPAAILNFPFYSPGFPDALQYGSMGSIMGHELTHGFDDEGVQWDSNGKLSPWIDSYSSSGFKKMAGCVINEYNNFCYPSISACINGQNTQGENIADNGGIKASWNAYKAHQKNTGVQPNLPGSMGRFTQDQLFFLGFAHNYCGIESLSDVKRQILLDPHSPGKYRVIGTLQNMPQFKSAFNCPNNSPMTPTNHCNVW